MGVFIHSAKMSFYLETEKRWAKAEKDWWLITIRLIAMRSWDNVMQRSTVLLSKLRLIASVVISLTLSFQNERYTASASLTVTVENPPNMNLWMQDEQLVILWSLKPPQFALVSNWRRGTPTACFMMPPQMNWVGGGWGDLFLLKWELTRIPLHWFRSTNWLLTNLTFCVWDASIPF